jgi:4-aminobutyrate aminotransferase-like enzyme
LEDSIRKVIDEVVGPRTEDARIYLAAFRPDALPLARADLIYLWDEYHTEYLDFASLAHPVGHAHPIIARQVDEHHRYYGMTAPQGHHIQRWPVQYAKELSQAFTGQGEQPRQVLFTEGEREAVLQSVRLVSGWKPVLTVGGDYEWLPGGRLTYPDSFDPAEVEWERAGGLLINLAGPDAHVTRAGPARRWILAARNAGLPVIVDETVTGFGRLGTMWGHQMTGLSPDVVILGGPAGGGYPLGAVIAPPAFFAATHHDVSGQSGNPISCCAGSALLTVLGLGTLEYMTESVTSLDGGLGQLVDQFGDHLRGHHGYGHLRGLRLSSPESADRLVAQARVKGLYLPPAVGDVVVIAPVLITSSNELTRAIDVLADVLISWEEEQAR